MNTQLWAKHLICLKESLITQTRRVRAGSKHTGIKGSSIETILRKILYLYLPNSFHVGTGQFANHSHKISPQIDILIYDRETFPHLSVNEDSSVIICCESLYSTIECKTKWNRRKIENHFDQVKKVDSKRYGEYFSHPENTPGYFIFLLENLPKINLSDLSDNNRFIGIYSLEGGICWRSPFQTIQFTQHKGNALDFFLKDVLHDCMRKNLQELGTRDDTYKVVSKYLGWKNQ